jgi:hypothetical protein
MSREQLRTKLEEAPAALVDRQAGVGGAGDRTSLAFLLTIGQ